MNTNQFVVKTIAVLFLFIHQSCNNQVHWTDHRGPNNISKMSRYTFLIYEPKNLKVEINGMINELISLNVFFISMRSFTKQTCVGEDEHAQFIQMLIVFHWISLSLLFENLFTHYARKADLTYLEIAEKLKTK